MRVAVAGATGVLGRSAMSALATAGHEAVGLARGTPGDRPDLVSIDVLDRDGLLAWARERRPEAIVHLATAIPAAINPRRVASEFALTNRLRTEGTRNLADAAAAAGGGGARLICQSIAFVYRPAPGLAIESDELWHGPPMEPVVPAIAELERITAEAGGTVLRFGNLYGPGTAFDREGAMGSAAAARRLPILTRRDGREAVFSFIHADDAGAAVLAGLAQDTSGGGTFNIVDDDPAPVSDWLPALAAAHGGKPPRRLPALLARPAIGPYGVAFMTELRGASNARARAELGWEPRVPSWREGFLRGM